MIKDNTHKIRERKLKSTRASATLIAMTTVFLGIFLAAIMYFILPQSTSFCADLVPQYRLLFVAIVCLIIGILIAVVFRSLRIIRGFFIGIVILSIVLIGAIFWCSTRPIGADSGSVLNSGTESVDEVGELEVSQDKLRDVVTTNLENLAALEQLRDEKKSAQSAGVATSPQSIVNNYFTTAEASDTEELLCDTDEFLIFDSEWTCIELRDAIENTETDFETLGIEISSTKEGSPIGAFTDGQGNTIEIEETITGFVENTDGSLTYTAEDGAQTDLSDQQILTFDDITNILTISNGNTADLSELDHEQQYIVNAGPPVVAGVEIGDWYEDSDTSYKYIWDGSQWNLLESTRSCYLGGATVNADGSVGKSNGVISTVTRNAAGEYTIGLSRTLSVDEYIIQATAHDTDEGQINQSNAIIDIITKDTTSFEMHINFGDNGGTEDVSADSNFDLAVFDVTCDPIAGSPSATGMVNVTTSGTTTTDRSNAGLEMNADGLSLLRGCDDAEVLAWDATSEQWECQSTSPIDIGSAYDVYDNTGGQAYTTGVITINLDTVRHTHTNYSLAANVITVNSDGLYEVTFDGSADNPTNNTRSSAAWWLETDTSGAFVEVDGSRCFTYHRTAADGEQSCSRTVILDLTAADQIRLRSDALDNNTGLRTLADGTSVTLKKFVESGADYAEVYYTNDDSLEAGDIVSHDTKLLAGVQKSTQDSQIFGIVSTDPGGTIGAGDDWEQGRPVPVALSGRVPVKVEMDDSIESGDLLELSSESGIARKSAEGNGYMIGTALSKPAESPNPDANYGTVLAFINFSDQRTQYESSRDVNNDATIQKSDATISVDNDDMQIGQWVKNAWLINKDLLIKAKTIFEESVVFISGATFMDRIGYGDMDAGGFAVIQKGDKAVEIKFENEFIQVPVVTVNAQDTFALVTTKNVTKEGFTIELKGKAVQDTKVSWTAIHVLEPRTTRSTDTQTESVVTEVESKTQERDAEPDKTEEKSRNEEEQIAETVTEAAIELDEAKKSQPEDENEVEEENASDDSSAEQKIKPERRENQEDQEGQEYEEGSKRDDAPEQMSTGTLETQVKQPQGETIIDASNSIVQIGRKIDENRQ